MYVTLLLKLSKLLKGELICKICHTIQMIINEIDSFHSSISNIISQFDIINFQICFTSSILVI